MRLRALELIEERGERVGQNDFMRALQGAESGMALEDLQRRGGADKEKQKEGAEDKDGKAQDGEVKGGSDAQEAKGKEGIGMNTVLDLDLLKKDQNKLYPIIYYTLKGLLQDWERSMSDRPGTLSA